MWQSLTQEGIFTPFKTGSSLWRLLIDFSTNCGLPSVKVSFRMVVLLRKSTYHFITSLCCGGILQNELYFKKLSPERVSNSCEFCFAVENLTCYNYANVCSLPSTFAVMWMLRFCRDSCFFFDGERETRNESCDVGFLKSGQLNFLFFIFLSIEYERIPVILCSKQLSQYIPWRFSFQFIGKLRNLFRFSLAQLV